MEYVVGIDGPEDGACLAELEAAPAADFDFEKSWQAVEPDDLLTIVYTSGTTGKTKGVEITHANVIANRRAISELGLRGGASQGQGRFRAAQRSAPVRRR